METKHLHQKSAEKGEKQKETNPENNQTNIRKKEVTTVNDPGQQYHQKILNKQSKKEITSTADPLKKAAKDHSY